MLGISNLPVFSFNTIFTQYLLTFFQYQCRWFPNSNNCNNKGLFLVINNSDSHFECVKVLNFSNTDHSSGACIIENELHRVLVTKLATQKRCTCAPLAMTCSDFILRNILIYASFSKFVKTLKKCWKSVLNLLLTKTSLIFYPSESFPELLGELFTSFL